MDVAIRAVAQISLSMPVFYIGLVLLIGLAAGLHWFPVGGIGTGFWQDIYYLFLPGDDVGPLALRRAAAQSAASR